MKDKIKTLKAYLPDLTTEFPHIYNFISKGIHELTEEESAEYFNILKLAIEFTIKERITIKQAEKNKMDLKNNLAETATKNSENK